MTERLISATAGRGAGPMQTPLSPAEFCQACSELVAHHAGDEAHRRLDWLVTDLLSSLGYGDGMAIFLKGVAPYHSGEAA